MHELHRPDVEPAGGLRDDEQAQRPAELAGEHDLLLVPARQRGRSGVDPRRADVELLDPLGGVALDGAEVEGEAAPVGRSVVQVEHEVLGHGEGSDEPVVHAVLRHVADAGGEHVVGRPIR